MDSDRWNGQVLRNTEQNPVFQHLFQLLSAALQGRRVRPKHQPGAAVRAGFRPGGGREIIAHGFSRGCRAMTARSPERGDTAFVRDFCPPTEDLRPNAEPRKGSAGVACIALPGLLTIACSYPRLKPWAMMSGPSGAITSVDPHTFAGRASFGKCRNSRAPKEPHPAYPVIARRGRSRTRRVIPVCLVRFGLGWVCRREGARCDAVPASGANRGVLEALPRK